MHLDLSKRYHAPLVHRPSRVIAALWAAGITLTCTLFPFHLLQSSAGARPSRLWQSLGFACSLLAFVAGWLTAVMLHTGIANFPASIPTLTNTITQIALPPAQNNIAGTLYQTSGFILGPAAEFCIFLLLPLIYFVQNPPHTPSAALSCPHCLRLCYPICHTHPFTPEALNACIQGDLTPILACLDDGPPPNDELTASISITRCDQCQSLNLLSIEQRQSQYTQLIHQTMITPQASVELENTLTRRLTYFPEIEL